MQNYWIGIMAGAFVVAMAAWLLLVFNADRHPGRTPQSSAPQREVIGGEFEAREGGRQLMPHPAQPFPAPDFARDPASAGYEVPGQRIPAEAAPEEQSAPETSPGRGGSAIAP